MAGYKGYNCSIGKLDNFPSYFTYGSKLALHLIYMKNEAMNSSVEQTELESISDYFELPPEAQEFLKQQESNQRTT